MNWEKISRFWVVLLVAALLLPVFGMNPARAGKGSAMFPEQRNALNKDIANFFGPLSGYMNDTKAALREAASTWRKMQDYVKQHPEAAECLDCDGIEGIRNALLRMRAHATGIGNALADFKQRWNDPAQINSFSDAEYRYAKAYQERLKGYGTAQISRLLVKAATLSADVGDFLRDPQLQASVGRQLLSNPVANAVREQAVNAGLGEDTVQASMTNWMADNVAYVASHKEMLGSMLRSGQRALALANIHTAITKNFVGALADSYFASWAKEMEKGMREAQKDIAYTRSRFLYHRMFDMLLDAALQGFRDSVAPRPGKGDPFNIIGLGGPCGPGYGLTIPPVDLGELGPTELVREMRRLNEKAHKIAQKLKQAFEKLKDCKKKKKKKKDETAGKPPLERTPGKVIVARDRGDCIGVVVITYRPGSVFSPDIDKPKAPEQPPEKIPPEKMPPVKMPPEKPTGKRPPPGKPPHAPTISTPPAPPTPVPERPRTVERPPHKPVETPPEEELGLKVKLVVVRILDGQTGEPVQEVELRTADLGPDDIPPPGKDNETRTSDADTRGYEEPPTGSAGKNDMRIPIAVPHLDDDANTDGKGIKIPPPLELQAPLPEEPRYVAVASPYDPSRPETLQAARRNIDRFAFDQTLAGNVVPLSRRWLKSRMPLPVPNTLARQVADTPAIPIGGGRQRNGRAKERPAKPMVAKRRQALQVAIVAHRPGTLNNLSKAAARQKVIIFRIPCPDMEAAARSPNDPYYQQGIRKDGKRGAPRLNQWGLKRIGFDATTRNNAWRLPPAKTRKITVALVDTGIDWEHPDVDRRMLWRNEGEIPGNNKDDDGNGYVDDVIGWDFVDDDPLPWDMSGHGTFVAGIIAARRNNGLGIAGLADTPTIRIMALRALGPFGSGRSHMVAQAIIYAVDNGADVINLSLAVPQIDHLVALAVEYALRQGRVVVAASGNEARQTSAIYPARLRGVVTVAATNRQDGRARFSNWGPHVDIAAPGVNIISLRARNTDMLAHLRDISYQPGASFLGAPATHYVASGTSFAAPFVSGVIAYVLSRRPEVTPRQAARMVLNAARDIETPGIDNYTGYGLLDAVAALRADPKFHLEARIAGVRLVRSGKGPLLQVLGQVGADRLKEARLYLGRGNNPRRWRQVGATIHKKVRDGVLGRVPVRMLAAARRWTLRLVVTHTNGRKREARFAVKLR